MLAEPGVKALPKVLIRELKSIDDHARMRPIMARVWGSDFLVPHHLSFKIAQYGGVVLGAFIAEEMVGFTLSFPMYWNYLHGLYIHMTAVLPEHQSNRIGVRLRLSLGLAARARGHRMVTWTYDPLESPTARLNIDKIGAVCNDYMVNYYGNMNDNRNRGIESDRFQTQWWVETPRVAMLLEQYNQGVSVEDLNPAGVQETEVTEDAGEVNGVSVRSDGLLVSAEPRLDLRRGDLLLRIPKSFQTIKEQDHELATQWRVYTRSVFTSYFGRGWTVTGFVPGIHFNTYVLQK